MIFEHAVFIKPNVPFKREFSLENHAPMFRKKFIIDRAGEASLYVCGLGYGYYYINGKKVTEDLFTAPVSDYRKTLWYNRYDVTELLQEGENTIAVICGNGWYNESRETDWYFNNAPWRDLPKVILRLEVDGETALVTDASWKCKPDSAVVFNQLRSGEYFDARLYEADWMMPEFDDSSWENAARDVIAPSGEFRLCECEPIREHETYQPIASWKISEKQYIFDLGQNISGYIRLTAKGNSGDEITIRYAEVINEKRELEYYGMDVYSSRPELGRLPRPFQTDKFICSGERMTWSPMFTYHGFRYIEVNGVENVADISVQGVFVHQAIARRTEFACSDEYLTGMFRAGVMASWSNMFYMLTDCPTREKLGWCNDAKASTEQMLTNFEIERLLTKWMQDIRDAMLPDGALPGIVPTSGWGFHWGNGPVSEGILFEIPYRVYLHTGNCKLLTENLDLFERNLQYYERNKNADGLVDFGLDDWAAPGWIHVVETGFVNAVLIYSFYKIAYLAAVLAQKEELEPAVNAGRAARYLQKAEDLKKFITNRYIDEKGRCTIQEQCSVAMLIYYDLYDELEPLKQQLKEVVETTDYHLKCGMVGLRHLLLALNKCDLADYVYKLLTVEGYPGFKEWFDRDATTLWEKWDINQMSDSKNHHMYSDFMSWMIKTLAGIRINQEKPGELEYILEPVFLKELDWVKCSYETVCGKIAVSWKRDAETIVLTVEKEPGVKLLYEGSELHAGKNIMRIV